MQIGIFVDIRVRYMGEMLKYELFMGPVTRGRMCDDGRFLLTALAPGTSNNV